MYAYFNAVLDENPNVVKLVADDACYPVVIGPVPDGQQSIPGRVTVEMSTDSDDFNRGYDAGGALVVLFRA